MEQEKPTAEDILGQSPSPEAEIPTPDQPQEKLISETEAKRMAQERINELTKSRREAEERAIRAEERARVLEMQRFNPPPIQEAPKDTSNLVGEMTREKWQEWYEEDPLAATQYASRLEAEKVADEKAKQVVQGISRQQSVSEVIDQVYKAHPELKEVMDGKKRPEEVPFWGVFDEVAREMEDAKFLVRGPLIVMKEAERRVKEKEFEERQGKFKEEAVMKEKEREKQVNAGFTAGSSPKPPSSAPVRLTPEEEIVARKMRMTPEEYAKFKA